MAFSADNIAAMQLADRARATFPASPIGTAYRALAAQLEAGAKTLRAEGAPRSDAREMEQQARTLRGLSEGLD